MRLFKVTFFIIFLIFAFSSCTLQKRLYNKGFYVSNQSSAKKTKQHTAVDTFALLNLTENETELQENKKTYALLAMATEKTNTGAKAVQYYKPVSEIKNPKPNYLNLYVAPLLSKKNIHKKSPTNKTKELKSLKNDDPLPDDNGVDAVGIIAFVFTFLMAASFSLWFLTAGGILILLAIILTLGLWLSAFILSMISLSMASNHEFKPIKKYIWGIIAFVLNVLITVAAIFIISKLLF